VQRVAVWPVEDQAAVGEPGAQGEALGQHPTPVLAAPGLR
jgi:hypothetical protein